MFHSDLDAFLQYLDELCVLGHVSCENRRNDELLELFFHLRIELCREIVSIFRDEPDHLTCVHGLENRMLVLHGQLMVDAYVKLISDASMVQIMAKPCHQTDELLKSCEVCHAEVGLLKTAIQILED